MAVIPRLDVHMAAFLQQVAVSDHRFLWLDDTEYAGALLAGGVPPWLDATGYVAWRRKAHSLLRSSVVALPVGPLCLAWLADDRHLAASMSVRDRVNYPLKTLLAASALRLHLGEILGSLRSSFPTLVLALVCPSPRSWVSEAYRAAFGESAVFKVGEDEVDAATLHCADFLREFGASAIDTVLLEESTQSEPANSSELEWYRSVLNVGAHYRWDIGLRLPGSRFMGGDTAGFSYVIGPRPLPVPCFGQVIPADFWTGEECNFAPEADFRYAQIPLGIEPEVILERLAELREP
jgi:hypothetical protein